MRSFLFVICLAFPAVAQQPEPRPDFVMGFPEYAVTKAGTDAGGHRVEPAPERPTGGQVPASPAHPETPRPGGVEPPPAAPINTLWPKDTVPIFMRACTGYNVALASSCGCVITRLMAAMPHDEFLARTAAGTLEQDTRVVRIRHECVGPAQKR